MTSQPRDLPHRSVGFEFSPDQLLFTTEEAAEVLRVGRTTVYALIRSGDLRPVHIGRCCRISRGELDRYVERLDTAQARPSVPIWRPRLSEADLEGAVADGSPQDAAWALPTVRPRAQDQQQVGVRHDKPTESKRTAEA